MGGVVVPEPPPPSGISPVEVAVLVPCTSPPFDTGGVLVLDPPLLGNSGVEDAVLVLVSLFMGGVSLVDVAVVPVPSASVGGVDDAVLGGVVEDVLVPLSVSTGNGGVVVPVSSSGGASCGGSITSIGRP
jgi:hypothetical protein